MRSKRVQRRRGSVVVEQGRDAAVYLAAFATAPISSLDTHECDRQTAAIPPSKSCCASVPMRILVAGDDAPLADVLRQRLVQEQFAVQLAVDGTEAQRLAANQAFDLVILDLNLPGTAPLDVLRGIRSRKPDLPVVVVASSSMVEERVRGLNAGADDYVAKPFAFAELAARIRAVLRRGSRPANALLRVADLALDRVDHTVKRNGHNIELSPKEFALLEFLMRHAGQPVTRTSIVEHVWKLNFDTMTNVVDVYINYLRRKVDSGYDHALIRTVRGVGYQIGGNGNAV
jgi:two-component system, OmpR family, copper resistance phosphate regulon response regulator CusR